MTPEMQQEIARLREADDRWTGSKLVVLTIITVLMAFAIIYIISGMNGVAV